MRTARVLRRKRPGMRAIHPLKRVRQLGRKIAIRRGGRRRCHRMRRRGRKWMPTKRSLLMAQRTEAHSPAIDVQAIEQVSYEDGFWKGSYEQGEGCLDRLISEDNILPDISLEQVIALGFEQVKHLLQPLLDPFTVYTEMKQALEHRLPLSVVRLGDGELLALERVFKV